MLLLLNYNLNAGTIITLDPYDDTSVNTNTAFNNSNIWINNLHKKVVRGIPLSDEELNVHTFSCQYLANLKFDEIALENLTNAIDIREKLPLLLQNSKDKEDLCSSAFQLMRDYYRAHEFYGNQDDVSTLESESLSLKTLIERLEAENLLSDSNRILAQQTLDAIDVSIRASMRVKFKRLSIHNEDGNMRPYSEARDFSPDPTDAIFPELEEGKSIKEQLQNFRERIRQHAIGQPEVENAFVRMELQKIMGMRPEGPLKLWLLGLPGVGKDTYVEALALALHPNDPLAHKKHVYSMEVCKNDTDRSNLFGAGKSYVGSQTLPTWIHFVVQHSGGKYQIARDGSGYEYVKEGANPDMKYFSPDEGILFVNEFHDWNPQAANDLLKQVIERGRIPLRSSGGSKGALSEIFVPIRIVVASNDGIELLRDKDFGRKSDPGYEKVMERWKKNAPQKDEIRARILGRGDNLKKSGGVLRGRLSDEFMSRFADSELLLLRPLDRLTLLEIARLSIKHLRKIMIGFSRALGGVSFNFTPRSIDALVDHHTRSDDGARRLKGGIQSYFTDPLLDAVADGVIEPSETPRTFEVDYIEEKSGDISLNLKDAHTQEHHRIIVDHAEVKQNIFDPEFIKSFDVFEENFNKKIFGAPQLASHIRESLYLTEHYAQTETLKSARKFALLGLSSTGKTQAAKEITRFYFKSAEAMETLAFDNINHEEQLKQLIYGKEGGDPSPFMEAYDRNSGKALILLDEVANIRDPIVLKALYRILDEAVVTGFNDSKPRSMEGIIFVLTGNAGQEVFLSIPRDLPSKVQRQAQLDIYERIQNDPHEKRTVLERHFPPALFNRIGEVNTHIMAPLSHEALRLLMHDKLSATIERVNKSLATNGAELVFENPENYLKFVEAAEEHFFDVWQQGRSVDDFSVYLEGRLLRELSRMGIQDKGEIRLAFDHVKEIQTDEKKRGELRLKLLSSSSEHPFELMGLNAEEKITHTKAEILQTAIHEAGHEIARRALSNEHEKPVRISIIPGLTVIGGEYVYYAGIAVSETIERRAGTREQFVSRLAKLYAGAEAQRLVNRGGQSDMGGSNDNMRADTYAAMALMAGGIDPSWGLESPHQGEKVEDYLKRITEKKREKFEKAKEQIKREAKQLATNLLRSNMNALMAMGRELAEKGEMSGEDIERFYEKNPVGDYFQKNKIARSWNRWSEGNTWKSWLWNLLPASRSAPKTLSAYVADPNKAEVRMPDTILSERKEAEVSKVPIPSTIKFKSCKLMLLK